MPATAVVKHTDLLRYGASSATQTPGANVGLKLAYGIIPSALFAAAAISLYWFPLTRRRHSTVRRALARRQERTAPGQ